MFVKILASIFVLTGTLGYGYCLIRDLLFGMRHLETQRKILMMMQGEIHHFHRNFPDTCELVGEKSEEPYHDFLIEVAKEMNAWKGKSLRQIWNIELQKAFPNVKKQTYMQTFAHLAEDMNCQESDMQVQTINYAKEMIEEQLHNWKQKYIQNRNLIIWLSGIAGFVCIVLFL